MEQSIRKQVIRRNIRFWGKQAEHMFFMMTGMILIYSTVFSSVFRGHENWDGIMYYLVLMGMMFAFLLPASCGSSYMTLVVSFGSKRCEAVWGIQVMNFLFGVQYFLLVLINRGIDVGFTAGFFRENGLFIGVFGALVVLAMAMGQLAAAATLNYGKKGAWATMAGIFLIMMLSTAAGLVTLDFFTVDYWQIKEKWGTVIWCGGSVTAIVLYVVSILVLRRVAVKYEVHA